MIEKKKKKNMRDSERRKKIYENRVTYALVRASE